MTTKAIGAGWLASCDSCKWERYEQIRTRAESAAGAHTKTCKGEPTKRATTAPKRASSASAWDSREDSTWIDRI